MAKFLTREEIYRLLQRELPPNVYPDGLPEKHYSTADMYSVADVVASGYANAKTIYDNYFPRTADENLPQWEILAYGTTLDKNIPIAVRRDRVEQKIRTRKGIRKQDIKDVVLSVLGTDKLVDIITHNNTDGAWFLDYSELGVSTFLNRYNGVDAVGFDACETDYASYGYTEEEWNELREDAYTYEVRVYGYILTSLDIQNLNTALDNAEPARCNRIFTDNLNPENMVGGNYSGFTYLLAESGDTLITESGASLGLG